MTNILCNPVQSGINICGDIRSDLGEGKRFFLLNQTLSSYENLWSRGSKLPLCCLNSPKAPFRSSRRTWMCKKNRFRRRRKMCMKSSFHSRWQKKTNFCKFFVSHFSKKKKNVLRFFFCCVTFIKTLCYHA
jgi:hypothetical protein